MRRTHISYSSRSKTFLSVFNQKSIIYQVIILDIPKFQTNLL